MLRNCAVITCRPPLIYPSNQITRDSRKKVEQVKTKKSKKEILKEQKAHADKYGGLDDDYGGYDEYSHMEDDFM